MGLFGFIDKQFSVEFKFGLYVYSSILFIKFVLLVCK